MGELNSLLANTLNDEVEAKDDYEQMIESIIKSDLSDEIKALATIIIEKIRVDEETHHEMLRILKEVLV